MVTKTSAGIDWLTATIADGSRSAEPLAWNNVVSRLEEGKPGAAELRPWSWMGYAGHSYEGMAWGRRGDGVIVRASRHLAEYAAEVLRTTSARASRVDFCLTWWNDQDEASTGVRAEAQALSGRETSPRSSLRKIAFINGHGSGDTLYIGSRSSNEYGRLYDKWRESGDAFYKHAWRAEIEYKHESAQAALHLWWGCAPRDASIARVVTSWWHSRAVRLVPGVGDSSTFVPTTPRPAPSDLSRLRWLRDQVGPAMAGLDARGLREEAEQAILDGKEGASEAGDRTRKP